jgi:hypothetical protein
VSPVRKPQVRAVATVRVVDDPARLRILLDILHRMLDRKERSGGQR